MWGRGEGWKGKKNRFGENMLNYNHESDAFQNILSLMEILWCSGKNTGLEGRKPDDIGFFVCLLQAGLFIIKYHYDQ